MFLGDFWSYNEEKSKFIVSPEPDVSSRLLDLKSMACVVVGSDGFWDMINPQLAVDVVNGLSVSDNLNTVRKPVLCLYALSFNVIFVACQGNTNHDGNVGAASQLKGLAFSRWKKRGLKADNLSVIVCEFQESKDDEVVMVESCNNMFQCMSVDHEKPCKRKREAKHSPGTTAAAGEREEKQSRRELIGCFIEGTCDDCLHGLHVDASDTE